MENLFSYSYDKNIILLDFSFKKLRENIDYKIEEIKNEEDALKIKINLISQIN